jgi:hypothetical protein
MGRLRALAAPLSPRRRRWLAFLAGLPLVPEELPAPVPAPPANDFIMCGCPRTGTTLLAAALFQPPGVITAMEPWDGMRAAPGPLFDSLRAEIKDSGRLTRTRLDTAAVLGEGAVRWCAEGEGTALIETTADWILGVKWTGYWRYLEVLPETKFIVCLRDPYEVVASCKDAGGRLRLGLQYETRFNASLNRDLTAATDDPARRRVLLYDYVHERLLPHLDRPNVFALRYERWFREPEVLMSDIGRFLGRDVSAPPVRIRPPGPAASRLTAEEIELVRSECRTAAALGYDLDAGPGRP